MARHWIGTDPPLRSRQARLPTATASMPRLLRKKSSNNDEHGAAAPAAPAATPEQLGCAPAGAGCPATAKPRHSRAIATSSGTGGCPSAGPQHHHVTVVIPGHWRVEVTFRNLGRYEMTLPALQPPLQPKSPATGGSQDRCPSTTRARPLASTDSNHRSPAVCSRQSTAGSVHTLVCQARLCVCIGARRGSFHRYDCVYRGMAGQH